MNQSVTPLAITFDCQAILDSLPNFILSSEEFDKHLQFSITHSTKSNSWFDGVGSLYDFDIQKYVEKTSSFTIMNEFFNGTYIEEVISEVVKQATSDGVCIGRIRIMKLKPKTCYTLHSDPEEFRYHIPLIANRKCFFVVGEKIHRMEILGMLYKFNTQEEHTAVNASKRDRIHLVFDTYKNDN